MAFDIKAAQALMLNEEFNRKVDNVIAAKSQGKKSVASQFAIPTTMMHNAQPVQQKSPEQMIGESKLPQAILDSYKEMNNPLNDFSEIPASYFNGNTAQSPLNEAMSQNAQQTIAGNDIVALIDRCIAKHIAALRDEIKSEATIKAFRFTDGNKVQFLDRNGNIYEGVLTLKKKKKKK
nr:MAG TPA_asm: hypothetical protein [Caudoviricetes sp.]